VIPIAPYGTATTQRTVDRFRDANGETLDTAREPRGRVSFHQQVQMIGLDAVMDESEGLVGCHGEGARDGIEYASATQRRKARTSTQGDVRGTARIVYGAASVGHHPPAAIGLTAGARAPTAPGPN
jgi:hypothetical protein